MIDLFFIAKLFLVFYLWVLIFLSALLLIKSRNIYLKLKNYEELFKSKKKEFIHNILPFMNDLLKNIKKATLKDFLFFTSPFLFKSYSYVQGLRLGISLIKKSCGSVPQHASTRGAL